MSTGISITRFSSQRHLTSSTLLSEFRTTFLARYWWLPFKHRLLRSLEERLLNANR